MNAGLFIVIRCALLFLDIIELLMLVRMIFSWIFMDNQTKFGTFLFVATEPVILPIRALCDRFGWFRGLPLDIPFFITALLLMLLRIFMEALIF